MNLFGALENLRKVSKRSCLLSFWQVILCEMYWWTFTASPQLLRCTSRLCFGTSPLFIVYYSAELTHFFIRTYYADDTQLFISFQATKFSDNISCLQTCLGSIADWMTSNLLCFNCLKTEFLLLGLRPQLDKIQSPALRLSNGVSVLPSASACNLGFIFDSNLTLADQISSVSRSCFYHIRYLRRTRPVLDFTTDSLLAHLLFIPGLITVIHYIMVFQKSN